MSHIWILFCEIFTVAGLIGLVLKKCAPLPLFDQNGVTLVCSTKEKQITTAKMLALAIGDPIAELNTHEVHRFLFRDGTSVDWLTDEKHEYLGYDVIALKSIVLGLFSSRSPLEIVSKMRASDGYDANICPHGDKAFPFGDILIYTSRTFMIEHDHCGFGIIVRKHAFRIDGPRPVPFKGFKEIPAPAKVSFHKI
jgi:hypothetical protein